MSSSQLNISSTISPDILKNISTSTAINSFGNQLKDKAKEQITTGYQTIISNLAFQQEVLKTELKNLANKQTEALKKAKKDYDSKQLTKKEYDTLTGPPTTKGSISSSIEAEKVIIELQIKKLEEDITNAINSPYDKLKKEHNKFKTDIQNLKRKIKSSKTKAKKDLIKQVALNTAKTLAPILALQLVNQFSSVISQRKKLEIIIDQVNVYIDTQVKDEQTVIIATNLRNNAITLINNNVTKLEKIKKTLDKLVRDITIISAIITAIDLILSLNIPFLIPIQIKFQPRLQKVLTLISDLSVILAMFTVLLSNEIDKLNELKDRLKEISLKLDNKTLDNLDDQGLSNLSNAFLPAGGNYGSYKGFQFAVKDEQNPSFVVKGNKRRYAVAIDRYNVEIIKSDYSFTQDPNDLIEQIKLIIDQQNLQG